MDSERRTMRGGTKSKMVERKRRDVIQAHKEREAKKKLNEIGEWSVSQRKGWSGGREENWGREG